MRTLLKLSKKKWQLQNLVPTNLQVVGFRNLLTNLSVRYVAAMVTIALFICFNSYLARELLIKQESYHRFLVRTSEMSALSQNVIFMSLVNFQTQSPKNNNLVRENLLQLSEKWSIFKQEALVLDLSPQHHLRFYSIVRDLNKHISFLLENDIHRIPPKLRRKNALRSMSDEFISTQKLVQDNVRSMIEILELSLAEQTQKLKMIQWFSAIFIFSILLLQGVSILMPAIKKVRKTLDDLEIADGSLFKAREEAELALKIKSDFITKISHEIRNPLNAILGMGDLLIETPIDRSQKRYIDIFRRSAQTILDLINDFLDFSSLEAGRIEIVDIQLDLVALVERSTDIITNRTEEKGLKLGLEFSWNLPKVILGDPKRIQQILVNLLGNAVKFTNSGSIQLKVESEVNLGREEVLVFSISDTGIGIPVDRQQKIFDDFVQVDSSINRRFGGNGLGLAICRDLVKLMHGSIHLESQFGRGSTFTVRIPLRYSDKTSLENDFKKLELSNLIFRLISSPNDTVSLLNRGNNEISSSSLSIIRDYLSALELQTQVVSLETLQEGIQEDIKENYVYFVDSDVTDEICREVSRITKRTKVIWLCRLKELHKVSLQFRDNSNLVCVAKPIRLSQLFSTLKEFDDKPAVEPLKSSSIADSPITSAGEILIVEDSEDNRAVFSAYLKRTDHQVEFAVNGRFAFEAFTKKSFDLVFMDIQMPDIDGYEATRLIRTYEEKNKLIPTPIVALTAYGHKEELKKCLEAGCSFHLTKPIGKLALLKFIEDNLNKGTTIPLGGI